jgi:hypothetical protein
VYGSGAVVCAWSLLIRRQQRACRQAETPPIVLCKFPRPALYAEYDYTLAIKNKGRPPKPWRWEIYLAGKSKPVRQSEFLETMSEATRTGKAALAEVRAKRVERFVGRQNI